MNLLLCFLLMFAGLDSSRGVLSHTLVVSQSPDVSVLEGETVEISCCWTKTAERVGLKWLKNQTIMNNRTFINQSESFWNAEKNKCMALIFEKIKRKDSGRYICKVAVEIPVLTETEGNGTTITVTARENPPDSTDHQTGNEEKKEVAEDKRDDNSKTHIVDETSSVHLEDKEETVKHKEKITDRTINLIAKDKKEKTSKSGEKSGGNRNQRTADDGSQEEVLTFVLRSLPVLALITAFFWLYYLGIKAQKDKAVSAASGNEASSQQNAEEDQEEEKKEEIVTEEAREDGKGN